MAYPRQIEIKPENGAIAIRVINTDTPNEWEYYQFGAIKSVVPVSVLGMGSRQPDNNRKNPMRYDDELEFVINFHDENESSPIRYNIAAVQNQPTWTNDFAGLGVAVSDINSWIASAAASTPGVLDITNTVGSTLNTWKSFTVVCVAGTVDIGTETFPVGTYSFSNGNGTLNSIAYDASSSTDCKIIFVA